MGTMTILDGRYELRRLLGRGGMADVWAAHDRALGRDVAVKVLRGLEAEHEARFAAEVRTLARLDHPNLVRLLDAGDDDGRAYLVMDLVDGETLAEALRRGPLPVPRVTEVGAGLARALAAIHDQGVVHRDVKPGNVLLDPGGRVRLTDFGIARLVDSGRLTSSGATMGTAAYLAPEQVRGEPAGPPADVYALGLVLLEALTGSPAFTGPPMEAALARLSRDPAVPDGLPEPWPSLLADMTRAEPATRPVAADVVARLDGPAFVDEAPTTRLSTTERLEVPPVLAEPAVVRRRLPWWPLVVALGLALAVAVGVLANQESVREEVDPPTSQPAVGTGGLPADLDRELDELEELLDP
jgi:serine/threonine protein kinase